MPKQNRSSFSSAWQRVKEKVSRHQPDEISGDRRAVAAKGLLQNPTFNEAYACSRDDLMEAWANAETPQAREAIHAELMGLKRVVQKLGEFHRYSEIQAAKAAMADQRQ